MWRGHWKRVPPGDHIMYYLLAQLICDLRNSGFMGISKAKTPAGAKQKPDPSRWDILDLLPHWKDSIYDNMPEWTEEDEHKARAKQLLAQTLSRVPPEFLEQLNKRKQEKQADAAGN